MGTTSSVKDLLFGDTHRYSSLLEPVVKQLIYAYPSEDLQPIFRSLPSRSITVGPMAMCDRLLQDLGRATDDTLLQGVGAICLHISTHDDVIDEPAGRREQAARLYAGNIAFDEGINLLLTILSPDQLAFITSQVSQNHRLQQQCVDLLWERQPTTFDEYRRGVEHDGALIAIGVCAALAAANEQALWPQLGSVCTNYGVALQLLDDIAEVAEDAASGYHSFPLLEGAPYSASFGHIHEHLEVARQGLNASWRQFGELFNLTDALAAKLEAKHQTHA